MSKQGSSSKFVYENGQIPPGECVEFENFIRKFAILTIPACVAFTYLVALSPENIISHIGDLIPFFEGRIAYLKRSDHLSYVGFIATVISGAVSIPIITAFIGRVYWNKVVAAGKCKPVNGNIVIILILQVAFGYSLFFMAFIDVGEPVDPRWPGMTRILLWPIFPFFGAIVYWVVGFLIFGLSVGILKFLYLRES
ncbi:hypothetical protein [Rhizobium sp. CAU 1783]